MELKTRLRRWLRGIQRRGRFAVLLPHHRLEPQSIEVMGQGRIELTDRQIRALGLCDGSRTVAQVAREASVPGSWLAAAQEQGLLILWRAALPAGAVTLAGQARTIIVSPHPDDAALSCGGRMLSEPGVLVVNIFGRSAWWRFGEGDPAQIQTVREAEERLVSRLSGAAIHDLGLAEALLRGHAMDAVFTADAGERDREAVEALRREVAELAGRQPLAHWYLPLGVGNHIDHRIARDAGLAALRASGIRQSHLHFYEDLPYAAKAGAGVDYADRVAGLKLRPTVLDVEEVIGWKLEMLRSYWSQFTWGSFVELKQYAQAAGGEVVWQAQ